MLAAPTADLVAQGEISCESPSAVASWLNENGGKLFNAGERTTPAVVWFHKEFAGLLPKLAEHYARRLTLNQDQLISWLEFFYRYAHFASLEAPASERERGQRQYLEKNRLLSREEEAQARSQLKLAGRLMTLDHPLVMIFDDLDWIYRDEASALRLARMLLEFGKLVPNSLAIIGMNQDTWEETFEKGLPEAVRDRLTAHECRLEGVPRTEWRAFLSARAKPVEASQERLCSIVESLERTYPDVPVLMPRKLIRAACRLWHQPAQEKSTPRVFPRPEVATPPRVETTPVTAGSSNSPGPMPWATAMNDLRELIHTKAQQPAASRPPSPFIDVSADPSRAKTPSASPAKKPELTPEFQSFISGLRERAADKEAYHPHGQAHAGGQRAQTNATGVIDRPQGPSVSVKAPANGTTPFHSASAKPAPVTPEWVASRLRAVKMDLAQAPITVELPLLRRLIHTTGERFPAIIQDTTGSPNDPLSELRWRFQQSEIHFGFHPYEDTHFWRRLVSLTAERARDLRERDKTRVKLVAFARRAEEEIFASWNTCEQDSIDLQFCDVIFLSDHQLASVYAVDRLLASEEVPERHESVFAQLSGELNFFWKLITRPVWTLVSPIHRTAP